MTKLMYLPLFIFTFLCSQLFGQSTEVQLTAELQKHFENSNLPGFCVAIVNEKGVLYKKGFGYSNTEKQAPFTPKTIENLGSTSKAVLGMVLVKAIEDEKLILDSEINAYLPFRVVNPYHKKQAILIKHLATHSSSILDTKHYGKSYVLEEGTTVTKEIHLDHLNFLKSHKKLSQEAFLFNILNEKGAWYKKKNFIKEAPGSSFEYANLNAALAGFIIEKATNESLEGFSKKSVFDPLQMQATTWSFASVDKKLLTTKYFPMGKIVPNYGLITYPDGGLYSNVEDLSLFLQELIKAFSGNSTFLPPPYSNMLLPGDGDAQRIFIGMGVKSRNIGHAGSDPGVQTDLQFNADRKIGRVILCNVNAQDNEQLWKQYRQIHTILARYEPIFNEEY